MKNDLDKLITRLGEMYKDKTLDNSRNYIEVNLEKLAENTGVFNLKGQLKNVSAIIPIKHYENGMKVRIDGRTFVNYVQFESGIAIPAFAVKASTLKNKPYVANDSMILNCV